MSRRPLRVALTGGIATGKSHCLARFAARGIPTIDADRLARDALAAGTTGLDAVVRRFGPGVLAPDGSLDRAALANVVFNDSAARQDLEAIVHPFVYAAITGWFAGLGDVPFAVADIPLLFETGREQDFDHVIVTWCPPEVQMARLAARGLPAVEAGHRIASQMAVDDKARRADTVIDTSGAFAETDRQVDRIAEQLESVRP